MQNPYLVNALMGPRINPVSLTVGNPNVERVASEDEIARQRELAKAFAAQAAGNQNIQSPWQGANQLAQAAFGGYMEQRAASEEQKRREAVANALTGAIGSDTASTLGISEDQMRQIIALNPEFGQSLLTAMWQQRMQPPPERWEDTEAYGMPGQRSSASGKFEPFPERAAPQAEGGGLFSGTSVEAQALNYLVNNRVLTPQQAAELATAKQITDPSSGAIFLVLPSGVFRQAGPGQPAVPVAPPPGGQQPAPVQPPATIAPQTQSPAPAVPASAAPAADPLAVPPPPEGMVPITQPSPGAALTPAEKAVDAAYAKDYADWVAAGGYADVEKQLTQLEEAARALEAGDKNLTGPILGNVPDVVTAFTNPDVIATREAVEEVVQRNLRLVLGAQFTEKEGERLIARAYNPKLDEAENAKRVRRLIGQIRAAADAKNSAAEYFSQYGTLKGWSGKLPTMADFNPETDDPANDPLGIR